MSVNPKRINGINGYVKITATARVERNKTLPYFIHIRTGAEACNQNSVVKKWIKDHLTTKRGDSYFWGRNKNHFEIHFKHHYNFCLLQAYLDQYPGIDLTHIYTGAANEGYYDIINRINKIIIDINHITEEEKLLVQLAL